MRKGKQATVVVAIAAAFIATGLFLPGLARAGELEPPPGAVDASGKPVPTMHTLDEIYNLIDERCPPSIAGGVPRTGQTTSYEAGDDGDLKRGVAWTVPRFTDNGNGTVTDNLTGLIWLKNANCFGTRVWTTALTDCNALASGSCGLSDGSSAGDWRLPNIRELHSLVDYGPASPALPSGHPFSGVQSSRYWSSTTCAFGTSYAWYVYLFDGDVHDINKTITYYVWPVRGGE